jgi:hypothetical protein
LGLCLPLLLALITYAARDPFWVAQHHRFGNYYDDAAPVELNRDYASLEMFTQNYAREQFDSFIMGSSRSFPFHCDAWRRFVPDARPFHYPAASENIYGILAKLRFLDGGGVRLSHVLFEVTDSALAGVAPRTDHLHRLPRKITGESAFSFQSAFLKAYFTDFFWIKYLDYAFTGRVRPYSEYVLGVRRGNVRIDPTTNDYFFEREERELAADEEGYYRKRSTIFEEPTDPSPACGGAVIGPAQRDVLLAMREIFQKHRTDVRVIVSPTYSKICLNRDDLAFLRRVFGEHSVYDFSGRNPITEDKKNFYDPEHIRPHAAEQILRRAYANPARTSMGEK